MGATRRRVLQGVAASRGVARPRCYREIIEWLELIWYRKPAAQWTEALPLGNGRLGAMVFGDVTHERIQINESSLWGGRPHDYNNPQARDHLQRIRDLIFAGRISEAEELAGHSMGAPALLMPYQPFCDLRMSCEPSKIDSYSRSLSLDEACTIVEYSAGGIRFRREVIVSHPGQVVAVRLTADRPGQQNISLALVSARRPEPSHPPRAISLSLSGRIEPRENPARTWIGSWDEPGLRFAAGPGGCLPKAGLQVARRERPGNRSRRRCR